MKKLLVLISLAALFFTGCSHSHTNKQDNNGVHTHEDGSVHQNHQEDSTVGQEEFSVLPDTISQKQEDTTTHNHEKNGHVHPHNH